VNSLVVFFVAFSCIFGGTLLAMALSSRLPEHHLSEESKDIVKLGVGTIATLAALTLSLLIVSAKGTFDTMNNGLRETSAKMVLLDRILAQYGPETKEARDLLRSTFTSALQRIWPEEANAVSSKKVPKPGNKIEALQDKIRQLSPHNDIQRQLQERALEVSADIDEARWLLIEQVGQSSIPVPFLVVLLCWLTIIFVSFGLFSPWNGTVITIMFVCAISAAAAVYLILELDQPYGGLIKISSSPIHKALAIIGQ
jgi:hypothetical protein